MTSRIHRGFHRIGIVLAVPVLLLSAAMAGSEAWTQWTADVETTSHTGPRGTQGKDLDPFAKYLSPTPAKRDPFDELMTQVPAQRAEYTGAGIALGVALALYAAARAIGWVLDGFLSPSAGA